MSPLPSHLPIQPQKMEELRLLFGDEQELQSLFEDFFSDLPTRLVTLRAGLEKSTPELVNLAAHAIKGSSSSLGAKSLFEVARALEECARSEHLEQAGPWMDELDDEILRLREYLKSEGLLERCRSV